MFFIMELPIIELCKKLSNGEKVELKFYFYTSSIEETILTLLNQALSSVHLGFLDSIIYTIINELINNSIKANAKRVFFKKHTKDISTPETYAEFIRIFKEEAVLKIHEYLNDLVNENLFVQFSIHAKKDGIEIQVFNNVCMTSEEESRVQIRIQNAAMLKSMSEAFDLFSDDDEGAGLGIVLIIQLLKNAAIPVTNFSIGSKENGTCAKLFIPSSIEKSAKVLEFQKKIENEIIQLPLLSENIQNLIRLTLREDINIQEILPYLERDPVLCSELLKEASTLNIHRRLDSIREALEIVGKKGLYQLLSVCGSRQIMESRYNNFIQFWEHSLRCAFYARLLAEKFRLYESRERLYLAGLFHNLGKLILYSLKPENNSISLTMEEIQWGLSHSQVGALVAEKWGYSHELVSLLRNYLRPLASPEHLLMEASLLHIADYMVKIHYYPDQYIYLDPRVLKFLGFASKYDLVALGKSLDQKFLRAQQKTKTN